MNPYNEDGLTFYGSPDMPADPLVGCVCNGGIVYVGLAPTRCPHCGGSGSLPRWRLQAILAAKSENHRPLEGQ